MSAKFSLGQTVITQNAQSALSYEDILKGLARHANGDWGEVSQHDRQENELSLQQGFRLLSAYTAANGTKFWIIVRRARRDNIAG